MGTEFDLSRALFLTYVGVGAAFLVLGSLVVFTGLISWWGSWRLRRAQNRAAEAAALAVPEVMETESESDTKTGADEIDPQLAAAIGAAVALATDAYRREQAAEDGQQIGAPQSDGGGWREQGRVAAFDSRRVWERDR